ncbi:cilia- and flagella-associated protein 57-like [Centruroides vittatus]|uniref:cilia- and flagella-associated protein 57-like n=1 Tax=Centruroides vittatus TaxID=120091 RepID=UPI00350EAA94
MEPSIRLRGSYRGAFTKFTDRVQEFLTSKVEDFDSCPGFLAQLQEKYSKIETIDKEILDKLQKDEKCSQQMLDEEIEGIENYNGTFVDLKTRLERRLNTSEQDETRSEGETGYSKGNFKLPKIELQKFDGNLKNYLSFWGLFKKIHEDPNISDLDKFQYLIQSTLKGSRAREVIESFPVTAEHYSQAIECLNSRFGREDVLI